MSALAISLIGIVGALMALVSALSLLSPTRVEYSEGILIDAPAHQVYDDIRFQSRLMRWSAWPKETGSKCSVDEGKAADGFVGTRTAFFSKGKQIGFQEVVDLKKNQEVTRGISIILLDDETERRLVRWPGSLERQRHLLVFLEINHFLKADLFSFAKEGRA
ncbi:MAG: hypothetical protein AAFU85_34035, partial [Planctomycetota bacterium]